MHIFLTGAVQVGKSTIIQKTLRALEIFEPGGFQTISVADLPAGAMSVYLISAGKGMTALGDENRVGIRRGEKGGIEKFPQVFDREGLRALEGAEGQLLIVMDEIGRMEEEAAQFSARILELLDGRRPILGVLQQQADTALTRAVRAHPNVRILTVTEENRDDLAGEVLKLVRRGISRTQDSAGAIVFRGDAVLMIHFGGRWSFPKGHLLPGETKKEAALRETREETGIEAEILDFPLAVPSSKPEDARTVWFFPARYQKGTPTPQADELSEAAWVLRREAAARISFEPDKEAFFRACEIMDALPE